MGDILSTYISILIWFIEKEGEKRKGARGKKWENVENGGIGVVWITSVKSGNEAISIGPTSYQPLQPHRDRTTFHDFHRTEPSRENPRRHHSRSFAITQLAGILFFAPGGGGEKTLSRMGSSTIFQRSYSKTRTFSNFRFSRFIPLLLVLAIEIKSASITPVSLVEKRWGYSAFFLSFFFFPPTTSPRTEYLLKPAFETVTSFEIDFCKLSTANLYTLYACARVYVS